MIDLRRRYLLGLMPTDIIINRKWGDNDAALMDVIYAKGWSKSENYMTKREAETVTTIGSAFAANTVITDLSVLQYFSNAKGSISFKNCTSLTKVTIPEGITSLANDCLYATLVEKIYIPKNVKSMATTTTVFYGANRLNYIEVDNNNTTYHSYKGLLYITASATCAYKPIAFKGDIEIKEGTKIINRIIPINTTGVTSIYVPDGVESIARNAFNFSNWGVKENMGTLRIPSSVNSLGSSFARGSGFERVDYYSKVTIPQVAFLSCLSLNTLVIYNTEKMVELELIPFSDGNYSTNHPFRECAALATIYVPDALLEEYKNSEMWQKGINLTTKMKPLSTLPQ